MWEHDRLFLSLPNICINPAGKFLKMDAYETENIGRNALLISDKVQKKSFVTMKTSLMGKKILTLLKAHRMPH